MPSGQWRDQDLGDRPYSEEMFPGLPSRDLSLGASDDGKFLVGLWEATHGECAFEQPTEEFGSVVAGGATIEVDGEPALRIGPGDTFFIPSGRKVKWTVENTIRKFYAVRLNG